MTAATKLSAPRHDGFATHREVALAYAEVDYEVAPFARNRRPLTQHGHLDATTDRKQVAAWWTRHAEALILVIVPDGVVVLDLDAKKGKNGVGDFKLLAGVDPDAVVVPLDRTQTGGLHLWLDDCGKRFNLAESILERYHRPSGVDVIPVGMGVFVPGLPGSGRVWLKPLSTPLASVPDWIPEAVERPAPPPSFGAPQPFTGKTSDSPLVKLAGAIAALSAVPPGQRGATMQHILLLAGMAGGGEIDPDETRTVLLSAVSACPGASHLVKVRRFFDGGFAHPLSSATGSDDDPEIARRGRP
jgi:hypothetical protein